MRGVLFCIKNVLLEQTNKHSRRCEWETIEHFSGEIFLKFCILW